MSESFRCNYVVNFARSGEPFRSRRRIVENCRAIPHTGGNCSTRDAFGPNVRGTVNQGNQRGAP